MTKTKKPPRRYRILAPAVDYDTPEGRHIAEAGDVVADLPAAFADWLVETGQAEEVSEDG